MHISLVWSNGNVAPEPMRTLESKHDEVLWEYAGSQLATAALNVQGKVTSREVSILLSTTHREFIW